MLEDRIAMVHDDEMAAIKDSRQRELPLFAMPDMPSFVAATQLWVVAVSEHQARLALSELIYPLHKRTKKECDARYISLLEQAMSETVSA